MHNGMLANKMKISRAWSSANGGN